MESVKVGLETMLATLRGDPFALESVHICIIVYDREAKILVPLTPLDEFTLPPIETPESGPTHTGAALELLEQCLKRDIIKSTPERKGDWKPLLFLMTDGKPSDLQLYNEMAPRIRNANFAAIVCCAAGMKAKTEPLKLLTDNVYALQTMDQADFGKFFKWVSDSICVGNQSMGAAADLQLPPPPEEVILI